MVAPSLLAIYGIKDLLGLQNLLLQAPGVKGLRSLQRTAYDEYLHDYRLFLLNSCITLLQMEN